MSEWAMKRFWKAARAAPEGDGWAVTLDDRPIRTPGRAPLVVPTEALANAIAGEWEAQEGTVDPGQMPFTRAANSAVDKVTPQFVEVADMLASYGETDLVCYRADAPEELALRQAEAWDPLMDWARSALGAPLIATVGIVPVPQPANAVEALRARVHGQTPFTLTSLHDLVALSGSLVIGLAAQGGVLPPQELWERSRVDETWQESQWGRDEEAAEAAAAKRSDFLQAATFDRLSRASA